ncbi:hypothetical protein PanWU01x14_106560, partial [Parasponia andersonii]
MKRKGAPTQQTRPNQGKRPKTDQWTITITISPCPSCGKNHSRECRKGAGLCLKNGNRGHFIKNYPEMKNNQKKPGGKLYAMAETVVGDETEADPSVIT